MITAAILGSVFVFTLLLNIPIAFCLGLASLTAFAVAQVPLTALPQRMFAAIDFFPFLAIPFFMLAGSLMERGGISRKLVMLANELMGPIRGGLAMTTCLACAFFAALSGSGPATVAAIGSIMYPEMVKQGYDKHVSAGLVSVAGGLGPIIPPSILMVVFGVVTETSIGALFLGGIFTGLVILLLLMVASYIMARRLDWEGARSHWSGRGIMTATWAALPALGMPLIILGGIYGGFFTPTEAAAVAVVYSFFVGFFVYKELKPAHVIPVLERSAVAATVVMIIIATSSVFSWMFAYAGISKLMIATLANVLNTPTRFLIVTTIILLIFGTFMDGSPIVILLMPFLYPLVGPFGIHPTHFGLITTVALVIGFCTPPVAINIYAASGLSGLPMEEVVRGQWPFLIAMFIGLIIVILVPGLSTWLPSVVIK